MPTLIAKRHLVGDYGRVAAGGIFSTSAAVADRLIGRGLAAIAEPTEDPPSLLALRLAVLAAEEAMREEVTGSDVLSARSARKKSAAVLPGKGKGPCKKEQ